MRYDTYTIYILTLIGKKIKDSKHSTMWAAWGSLTCSAACHDFYVQSKGKCLFIRNFVMNDQTKHIQGLRHILASNIFNMHKDNIAEHVPCARVNHKFMKATIASTKNTVSVQRGFRQYGQPIQETLDCIVDIIEDDEDPHFHHHQDRLCTCDCEFCGSNAPHPVKSCQYQCRNIPELTDFEKTKLGLYDNCNCACYECFGMPTHRMADCMYFWELSKYKKLELE